MTHKLILMGLTGIFSISFSINSYAADFITDVISVKSGNLIVKDLDNAGTSFIIKDNEDPNKTYYLALDSDPKECKNASFTLFPSQFSGYVDILSAKNCPQDQDNDNWLKPTVKITSGDIEILDNDEDGTEFILKDNNTQMEYYLSLEKDPKVCKNASFTITESSASNGYYEILSAENCPQSNLKSKSFELKYQTVSGQAVCFKPLSHMPATLFLSPDLLKKITPVEEMESVSSRDCSKYSGDYISPLALDKMHDAGGESAAKALKVLNEKGTPVDFIFHNNVYTEIEIFLYEQVGRHPNE